MAPRVCLDAVEERGVTFLYLAILSVRDIGISIPGLPACFLFGIQCALYDMFVLP